MINFVEYVDYKLISLDGHLLPYDEAYHYWLDEYGHIEKARLKFDAEDHFFPFLKNMSEENVIAWSDNIGELIEYKRNALKKQISKKTKISIRGTTDYNTQEKCPVCGHIVTGNYCVNCGQALDRCIF